MLGGIEVVNVNSYKFFLLENFSVQCESLGLRKKLGSDKKEYQDTYKNKSIF